LPVFRAPLQQTHGGGVSSMSLFHWPTLD